jgi:ethanolamine utilization protein EutN
MYSGKVIGTIVTTAKDPGMVGLPLLIVQKIENNVKTDLVIAADATRTAGYDDFVYLIGKKEASRVFPDALTPVDAAIVGFIDEYREEL